MSPPSVARDLIAAGFAKTNRRNQACYPPEGCESKPVLRAPIDALHVASDAWVADRITWVACSKSPHKNPEKTWSDTGATQTALDGYAALLESQQVSRRQPRPNRPRKPSGVLDATLWALPAIVWRFSRFGRAASRMTHVRFDEGTLKRNVGELNGRPQA